MVAAMRGAAPGEISARFCYALLRRHDMHPARPRYGYGTFFVRYQVNDRQLVGACRYLGWGNEEGPQYGIHNALTGDYEIRISEREIAALLID
jgi:hypothetical protein